MPEQERDVKNLEEHLTEAIDSVRKDLYEEDLQRLIDLYKDRADARSVELFKEALQLGIDPEFLADSEMSNADLEGIISKFRQNLRKRT